MRNKDVTGLKTALKKTESLYLDSKRLYDLAVLNHNKEDMEHYTIITFDLYMVYSTVETALRRFNEIDIKNLIN